MFLRTTAINKILSLKKRKKVIQGGTSASKTFGILAVLISRAAAEPNLEISVVSESIPHLRRGAIKDFLKIMKWTNRYIDSHWNRSLLTYTFSNGSYIEFFSADMEDKLRGARRNILYINEANNVTFEAYNQLSIRTNKSIYLDFNPTAEFWVHTEVLKDNDADFIVLTYKDNEALDKSIVQEIEKAKEKAKTSSYWDNWWKVYGLGQIGSLEGVIFDEWKQIKEVPANAELIGYGMDFGFTQDPTTLIAVYRYNSELILDELIYERNLTNYQIVEKLKELAIGNHIEIIADSAEPKSIEEIRTLGRYNIQPALKGADSIKLGIDVMKRFKLNVTENSTNLIKELRTYQWDKDREGNGINKPKGGNDHAIDAVRYFCLNKLSEVNKQFYMVD